MVGAVPPGTLRGWAAAPGGGGNGGCCPSWHFERLGSRPYSGDSWHLSWVWDTLKVLHSAGRLLAGRVGGHGRVGGQTLGLLHNLGDGRRHTARAFAPWQSHRRGEIFMTAISCHGDTLRHLATRINLWRHPSPYGDRRRKGETAART